MQKGRLMHKEENSGFRLNSGIAYFSFSTYLYILSYFCQVALRPFFQTRPTTDPITGSFLQMK